MSQPVLTAAETLASEVEVGQEITEVGTPDGPWYAVVKVNRKSLVVDADEVGPMRFPFGPTDVVLARPAA